MGDEANGQSEKTIDGERFLVNMHFHDYLVRLPAAAADLPIRPNHELADARWFTYEELAALPLGKAASATLKKLGALAE